MTDFTTAKCDVSVHFVGGEYVNFGGEIASFKPSIEANFADESVYDRKFPYYTMTGLTGGIEISGLRTGATGDEYHKEIHQENENEAFFCVMHKDARMMGPAGYIMVKNSDIMDSDGVFKIDGSGVAQNRAGFEVWRFGTILPRDLNTWRNQGSNSFPAPVAAQMAVINVIEPGSLTDLSIELNKGGATYTLKAVEESNRPVSALTRGWLGTNANPPVRVPASSLTGYRWRIRTSGSANNAEFYIGLVHLF